MKKLPIGVQVFKDMIREDYLYVDKTQYIYNLFAKGGKYFFLSRPRRFGKSLLLSTMAELFSGHQELFKGLWIYDKIEWESFPVIHLDFLGLTYENAEGLVETLNYLLDKNARKFGVELTEKGYDKRFRELIETLAADTKVVILVDEYDKPIIDFVDNPEIAKENRNVLRSFYGTIKSCGQYIKFAFITGVSKFSKVSVFSDLNNLRDITLSEEYAAMLGYTQEELRNYFAPWVKQMVLDSGKSETLLLEDIKRWYNGYSWDSKNFLYNPFSILNFFQEKRFGNFWFSSGTPTFLIKLIKEKHVDVKKVGDWEVGEYVLSSYDIENMDVASLLFQTGYITVKNIKTLKNTRKYSLSFPNQEVKDAFLKYLLADYVESTPGIMDGSLFDLGEHLEAGNLEGFMDTLKSVFAGIPYNIFIKDREAYYHSLVYLLLTLLGINIKAEIQTNVGRIDAVIQCTKTVYILEFKIGSAAEALSQIKENRYCEKYVVLGKEILMVGIGFDMGKRNIGDYKWERSLAV